MVYLTLRKYLRKEFIKDLQFPEELKEKYLYQSNYYNRTKQYMHANHFFGELLGQVRGRKMGPQERILFANLSSCAPIFDDFFENEADLDAVQNLLKTPIIENATNSSERLALHFLNNILASDIDKIGFLKAAEDLFLAQTESKRQNDELLSSVQLLKISERKGGYSGLMYGYLLEQENTERYLELAYHLGSFGQIMDDIFDIYDDMEEGIRTFANQSKQVIDLRFVLEEKEQKIISLAKVMAPSHKNYLSFFNVFQIFVSIIEIALEHYETIELERGLSPIDCLNIDRKYWIIDMEKASNIRKLFFKSIHKIH